MMDQEIHQSFELDFEIFSALNGKFKLYENQIEAPRLKSDDLLKEFENYVKLTLEIFTLLTKLLTECNTQRMNFRMILIKMSKDKMIVDKFFREEEGDLLILKKLVIHDELKTKIIEKNLDKITEDWKEIKILQNECDNLRTEIKIYSNKNPGSKTTFTNSMSAHSNKKSTIESSFNYSSVSFLPKTAKNNLGGSMSNYQLNNQNSTTEKNSNSPMNVSFNNTINDSNNDSVLKKMLNLDFNTEKYHIISSSPIQTPSNTNVPNELNSTKNNQKNIYNNLSNFNKKSNSVVSTPHKKSLNTSSLYSYSNINTERKENRNQVKLKKYSKSIDFDSSYDYFHCQTQENMGNEYLEFENNQENEYLRTDIEAQDLNYAKLNNLHNVQNKFPSPTKTNKSVKELSLIQNMSNNTVSNNSNNKQRNSLGIKANNPVGYATNNVSYKKSALKSLSGLSKDFVFTNPSTQSNSSTVNNIINHSNNNSSTYNSHKFISNTNNSSIKNKGNTGQITNSAKKK